MKDTRYISNVKSQLAKRLNQYYDPSEKNADLYTLTDPKSFTLFSLDLEISYSDSTHEDDTYWISDRKTALVYFWGKSNTNEDALNELALRVVNFIDTLRTFEKTTPPYVKFDTILSCPNDFIGACQAWVKSIDPNLVTITGDIQDVFEQMELMQYKFRKHCELIQNLTNSVGIDALYNYFKKRI